MNVTAQVISIAAAILILAFIAGWMVLRQRDKKWDASRKMSAKATPRSRRGDPRKDKTTGKTNQAVQDTLPVLKENQSGAAPEKDRVVSSPELKNSTSQEDQVFTLTPPGKNGRSKH